MRVRESLCNLYPFRGNTHHVGRDTRRAASYPEGKALLPTLGQARSLAVISRSYPMHTLITSAFASARIGPLRFLPLSHTRCRPPGCPGSRHDLQGIITALGSEPRRGTLAVRPCLADPVAHAHCVGKPCTTEDGPVYRSGWRRKRRRDCVRDPGVKVDEWLSR